MDSELMLVLLYCTLQCHNVFKYYGGCFSMFVDIAICIQYYTCVLLMKSTEINKFSVTIFHAFLLC